MGNSPSRPEISGDIAHGTADTSTSNPIKIGAVAKAKNANPGSVVVGTRAEQICDQFGIPYVSTSHPWGFQAFTSTAAAVASANLVSATGITATGLQLHISDLVITASTSTTAALEVSLYGATTTNELIRIRVNSGDTFKSSFRMDLDVGAGNALLYSANTGASIFVGGHNSL